MNTSHLSDEGLKYKMAEYGVLKCEVERLHRETEQIKAERG